ncbi:MAG TPA: CoA-binding protein [Bacteroidia bacterium]|nr:CoA-binding protein [Bacteroidia bacterium]
MKKKYTLVIGASQNPERYAHKAVLSLQRHGHLVLAVGLHSGRIGDTEIQTGKPHFSDVDTVSLYLSPQNQEEMKDYILSLAPRRIIFNPGTENPVFEEQAMQKGIEVLEACTLVLLATEQY